MKKFPVVSESGDEYLVDVIPCKFYANHYEVRVYTQYIGWFKRVKFHCVNDDVLGYAPSYDISKHNFDLVAMAKYEVKRLEDGWAEYERRKKLKAEAERKFEEWDGDCRE